MNTPTRIRIVAFALAFAISAVTIILATPGGAVYVAGRIAPAAGDAYERIAKAPAATAPIEVAILPGRIDVVGVREQRAAADADAKASWRG